MVVMQRVNSESDVDVTVKTGRTVRKVSWTPIKLSSGGTNPHRMDVSHHPRCVVSEGSD